MSLRLIMMILLVTGCIRDRYHFDEIVTARQIATVQLTEVRDYSDKFVAILFVKNLTHDRISFHISDVKCARGGAIGENVTPTPVGDDFSVGSSESRRLAIHCRLQGEGPKATFHLTIGPVVASSKVILPSLTVTATPPAK